MLRDRNYLTHIYDGNQAKILVNKILNEYIPAVQIFDITLVEFYGETLREYWLMIDYGYRFNKNIPTAEFMADEVTDHMRGKRLNEGKLWSNSAKPQTAI